MKRAMSAMSAEENLMNKMNSIAEQIVEEEISEEEFKRNLMLALSAREDGAPEWVHDLVDAIWNFFKWKKNQKE
jgi:hypothetical protein